MAWVKIEWHIANFGNPGNHLLKTQEDLRLSNPIIIHFHETWNEIHRESPKEILWADIRGNSSVKVKGHMLTWDNWKKKKSRSPILRKKAIFCVGQRKGGKHSSTADINSITSRNCLKQKVKFTVAEGGNSGMSLNQQIVRRARRITWFKTAEKNNLAEQGSNSEVPGASDRPTHCLQGHTEPGPRVLLFLLKLL